MKHLEGDSALTENIINKGREISKLVREAVTADRHSKCMSLHGGSANWTKAAQSRDHAVKLLKKRLKEIAEEI